MKVKMDDIQTELKNKFLDQRGKGKENELDKWAEDLGVLKEGVVTIYKMNEIYNFMSQGNTIAPPSV